MSWKPIVAVLGLILAAGAAACAARGAKTTFHDESMDFSMIRNVAVLPFGNLSPARVAGERARESFMTALQATGAVYVLPPGEVSKGLQRANVAAAEAPSVEEAIAVGKLIGADALVMGTVLEYGEQRSGAASANYVSLSVKLIETKTGRVVWTSSSERGGISAGTRIFGGTGQPLSEVTSRAVEDLIEKLFK